MCVCVTVFGSLLVTISRFLFRTPMLMRANVIVYVCARVCASVCVCVVSEFVCTLKLIITRNANLGSDFYQHKTTNQLRPIWNDLILATILWGLVPRLYGSQSIYVHGIFLQLLRR